MLKLIGLLLIIGPLLSSRAPSQTFTPVTYSFYSEPKEAASGNMSPPYVSNLSFSAANGYGQWVYDDEGRWILFGNDLRETTALPGAPVRPSGVIATGSLIMKDNENQATRLKVVANLQGSVRYVRPSADNSKFYIQGLNDHTWTNPLERQIDIRMVNGLPKPSSLTRVIQDNAIVTDYGHVEADYLLANVDMVGDNYEAWEDAYDIACDQKYLYVAWEHFEFDPNNPGVPGIYKIYARAVPLDGGSIASQVYLGEGRRPTVSCDVRNNPASPQFDVAFLQDLNLGDIKRSQVQGYVVTTTSLLKAVELPSGAIQNFLKPLHARIVTSSVAGQLNLRRVVYAIVRDEVYAPYLIYRDVTEPVWRYVDGAHPGLPAHHAPIGAGNFSVQDHYVQAFPNPYDGDANPQYDEFHCLYRLVSENSPLLTVRGRNNGALGTGDTRTCLNRKTSDGGDTWTFTPSADQYTGSANQMGLHVRWGTIETSWYNRDLRRLDEAIEENTLASYAMLVGDGTSHGGTVGAALAGDRTMLLWSDPRMVYTASSNPFSYSNANLKFEDASTSLNIGAGTSGATLIAMPNFECWFTGTYTSTTQELVINPNSSFHYYGTPEGLLAQNWVGFGTVKLIGGGYTVDQTEFITLQNPAKLFVHGGSEFRIGAETRFTSTNSEIHVLYDQNIKPLTAPPAINPNASGEMWLNGISTITTSIVKSYAPNLIQPIVVAANSVIPTAQRSTTNQFKIDGSRIEHTSATGGSEVVFLRGASSDIFRKAFITGSKFIGFAIAAESPEQPFKVTQNIFTSIPNNPIRKAAIWLKDSWHYLSLNDYPLITFSENQFETHRGAYNDGIFILDFDAASKWQNIDVHSNYFTASNGRSSISPAGAAIHLKNSSAHIANNIITGTYYQNGIVNEHDITTNDESESFICANYVSQCLEVGLKTSRYRGYAKLNATISNHTGHLAGFKDRSQIVFSNYSFNEGDGLEIADDEAEVEMRGVHTGGNDYAAYNTLGENNTNGYSTNAQITLVPGSLVHLGSYSSSTNTGHNNIIGNTSSDNLMYSSSKISGNVGNIDHNYWGGYTPSTQDDDARFPGIDFVRTLAPLNDVQSISVSCGVSTAPPPSPIGLNQSSQFEETCFDFYDRGKSLLQGEEFIKAYDTLRRYIETCYAEPLSYHGFGTIDGANSRRDTANIRYLEYREWLKSVLYLNTEVPKYWCADVGSILNTFNYIDPVRGFDINGIIAVIRFAEETGKCPTDTAEWHKDLKRLREIQMEKWEDTVQAGSGMVDTTIPSLEEIGLEILRGPQGAVAVGEASSRALISAEAVRNPFTESTALRVTLGRLAVVDVKIYDQLGRVVLTLNGEQVLDARAHEIPIDASTWSKGTYYARVSTISGDVQTVKLVAQ